ncbi:MAG: glycosyltransferase [Planctomycetales bacterium]|nr:glycosyltransferase [Planctomycetales bacterium]NIM09671.1 glycosyltransferase [Planctomycetales bacterium]NIN09154.1 glycosyltransferase [Planctomycetales bacterium]NIN78261.1 glycosyltransferase [Planctomycetales bacterium]NIO35452.1 glycosyltransferase [Planctomycetales bacterium]
MDISVIVPVYNEVENVRPCYTELTEVLEGLGVRYEIIFVDDGSGDGSSECLEQLAAVDQRVKLVQFRRNFGQTAAMSAGMDMAQGEAIVTIDGDLQNDPADIPLMLDKLHEGYDLVYGWRKDRQDAFWNRRLPSQVANWLIAKVTAFPVRDLGCTLKVLRREIAADLSLYGEMHRFIPILAHWEGARCVEVVTRHRPRRFGQTKYGIWRTFRVILDLITVKYMIRYAVSPMKLFGGLGLVACTAGLASGLGAIAMKVFGGVDMTGNPLLLATVFACTVGLQFFVLGLLGEVTARIYHECQGKKPYRVRRTMNVQQTFRGNQRAA